MRTDLDPKPNVIFTIIETIPCDPHQAPSGQPCWRWGYVSVRGDASAVCGERVKAYVAHRERVTLPPQEPGPRAPALFEGRVDVRLGVIESKRNRQRSHS